MFHIQGCADDSIFPHSFISLFIYNQTQKLIVAQLHQPLDQNNTFAPIFPMNKRKSAGVSKMDGPTGPFEEHLIDYFCLLKFMLFFKIGIFLFILIYGCIIQNRVPKHVV